MPASPKVVRVTFCHHLVFTKPTISSIMASHLKDLCSLYINWLYKTRVYKGDSIQCLTVLELLLQTKIIFHEFVLHGSHLAGSIFPFPTVNYLSLNAHCTMCTSPLCLSSQVQRIWPNLGSHVSQLEFRPT